MSAEIIYLLDRSAGETDDTCGMAFYWNRLHGKRGIEPVEKSTYLTEGIDIHDDLSAVASLEEITTNVVNDLIQERLNAAGENPNKETLYRRLGWLAAAALFMEPRVRADYENVATEHEIILDRDPLWVPVTPDRVLRHRQGRYLVYREYKTTITAGHKWISSWPYAIQVHLGIKAIEEELSEKVAFGQIVGLMKGDKRGERLAHPYVWAYRNSQSGEWTHDYSKARSAAWEHMPVWEYPGGICEWVEKLGPEVGLSQFPHSAPVFLNERMLDNWIARKTARMAEIEATLSDCKNDESIRRLYFEQRTKNCRPAFGDPCPFLAACWNAAINAEPLASGLYQERTPHHIIEINALREQGRM